jgi:uncharacterized membrane-anchored protein
LDGGYRGPWLLEFNRAFQWIAGGDCRALFFTKMSHTALFWAAFILTRPLGAVLGDFFDKPASQGGLAMSRYSASIALVVFIVACILIFRQHAAKTTAH